MRDVRPITPTTIRPVRVLVAIAAGAVLIPVFTFFWVEGVDRYQLWRAGGIWCATLGTDGTITKSLGADACGY